MSGITKYEYPLEICEFCRFTEWGLEPLPSPPYHLCEGYGCKEAQEEFEWEVKNDRGK